MAQGQVQTQNQNNNLIVFKKFRLEDISKDTTVSLQNFAGLYNQFGQNISNLLSGQLRFGNNVQALIYTSNFSTPSNYSDGANENFTSFAFQTGFAPTGLIKINLKPLNSGSTTPQIKPVDVSWYQSNTTQVTVNYITGLLPNGKYTITLLVI